MKEKRMTRNALYTMAGLAVLLLSPRFGTALAETPADVLGNWETTVETPGGNFTSTLKLVRNGDQLSGVSVGKDGKETKLNDLKLAGKTITFTEDVTHEGTDYHLVYTGTLDGDTITGTFETMGQTMNWSAKRAASPPAASVGMAGTWKITVQTPNGPRERTLVLKQEGEKFSGTITGPMDQVTTLQDVSLKGKELRFTVSFDRNGQTVQRTFVAAVDGDSLAGGIEGGDRRSTFTGKRDAAPVAASGATGTWKLSVKAPDKTYQPTITVTQQAGKWGGQLVDEQGDKAELKDMLVNGNQLSFVADLETGGMVIHLKFSGTLDGDKLKGTMQANGGMLPTEGERQKV
jgi:hypothetical protein